MKFDKAISLLLLASPVLHYATGVAGQAAPLDETKFKVVNRYSMTGNLPADGFDDINTLGHERYLGGGFVDGDDIYIVVGAERSSSKLAKIPLDRDATTGKIVGMQFANATVMLDEEDLDNGFQEDVAVGPGNQVFYSIVPDTPLDYPYAVRHGTYDSTAKTFTPTHTISDTTWAALNLTDPNEADNPFGGLFGIGFSPNPDNLDPRTNHGYMVGTAPYGFWQVGLKGDPSGYDPEGADTKLLCSIPDRGYPGGMGFIPSGSQKDSVMLADWDNGGVQILPLDYTTVVENTRGLCFDNSTGQPTLGTANPIIEDFATGVVGAWGFMFDPQTNDFFITSWRDAVAEGGKIFHFEGFPPGIDTGVVIANIETQVEIVGEAFLAGRRRRRGLRPVSSSKSSRSKPKSKSTKTPKSKKPKKGKKTEEVEETVIEAKKVISEVQKALEDLDAEELVEVVVAPLEVIIANPSFTEDVLSGKNSPEFVSNVDAVEVAVSSVVDTPEYASLDVAEQNVIQDALGKIFELLALLRGVIEGV